jgi:hypothetical protein
MHLVSISDVTAIYEALSHLRSATRSYVFVEIPEAHREKLEELIQTASKEASRHGIGLILAEKTSDFDSWEIVVESTRREPDPASLDELLGDQLSEQNKKRIRRWIH